MDGPKVRVHPTSVDGDGSSGPVPAPQDELIEKAALEAVSTSVLLRGEDPSSPYLRDAEHWIAVYSELYSFVVRIVERFRSGIPDLKDAAQEYLESHDVLIHEKQMQRFADRLAFWTKRAAELQADQTVTKSQKAP